MKLPPAPSVSDRGRCGSGQYAESARSVDDAARLLLDVIVTEAIFHRAAHDFLDAAADIDRDVLARHAAELLRERMRTEPKPPLPIVKRAVWRDLKNIFGWTHVAEIRPEGSA